MKKKQIEKMPLPRWKADLTGTVAIARMPENGLIVIDYIETGKKELLVRIGLKKTEYATYCPDTGVWHNCVSLPLELCEIKISQGNCYCEKIFGTDELQRMESVIRHSRMKMEREQRQKRLVDRCNQLRPLSAAESNFLTTWSAEEHRMYYKRKGRRVMIACSACENTGEYYRTESMLSYEESIRSVVTPRHGEYGMCPMCGAFAKYKAAGRTKGIEGIRECKYILQPFGKEDVVVRYFETYKEFTYGWDATCAWETAQEQIKTVEIARVYFIAGKTQTDYQKRNPYTGEVFWDDCNLQGMNNIRMHIGKTYRGNLNWLSNTRFRYAMVKERLLQKDYTDIVDYLKYYERYPAIEVLIKLNMTNVLEYILEGNGRLLNADGKNAMEILQVTKQRFNEMREKNSGIREWEIFRIEKKNNVHYTDDEVQWLLHMGYGGWDIQTVSRYTTITKLGNYLVKQIGMASDEKRACEWERFRQKARLYSDYLLLCERNGRDMSNPHKIYPQDLETAHNREVICKDKEKIKRESAAKNKDNTNIKKDAAEYNRKYKFRNDTYLIRAPKDAAEIYAEGILLDHCVGRAGYIEAMNRHETVILFLRRKENPDIPYYTLEIKEGKIRQAYGKGDEKPDWEQVGKFLDAFKKAKLTKNTERKAG